MTLNERIRALIRRLLAVWAGSREPAAEPELQEAAPTEPPPPEQPAGTGLGDKDMADLPEESLTLTRRMLAELRELMAEEQAQRGAEAEPLSPRKAGRPRKEAKPVLAPIEERVRKVGDLFSEMTKKPKTEMVVLITYDITSNKIRKKVSDYLEAMGCMRIQKSVFLGQIDKRSFKEIQDTIWELQQSYENEDSIIFLPVSESELLGMRLIGQEIDMSFVLGRQHTLFF